ncbi:Glutathione S-transferase gedE [Hyphodiscus hymeniophilus]|uniref:Glutathione S-transferase gedE n=1 Tax=Hyphodiscus hymeniophilus TaxID=353542 RepID=A0A9P6VDA2_9HELO|nr:Glutathione S-transferase gedE [Hyphodiscus hymeniophilus]
MSVKSSIHLYTGNSPNGHKISITLEELGLSYGLTFVDLPKIQHKEPWFLAINPNGRIPALTDTMPDGTPINLFESGSIQQYLVDIYDTEHKISYPKGSKEYYETNNWLFFQNAGVGPMQGQANHFIRYSHAPEPIPYAVDRYVNETRRLYRTVDTHLKASGNDYLVGNKGTIADIALFCWVNIAGFSGVDVTEFPLVQTWQKRMLDRSAVRKGLDVPVKVDLDKLTKEPELFKDYLAKNEAWIRKGMQDDKN